MGYYIQVPEPKGKAQQLVDIHRAEILPQIPATWGDVPADKALICVVDNGPFEAAGLAYNEDKYRAFDVVDDLGPDGERTEVSGFTTYHFRSKYQAEGQQRPRTWLIMDRELAFKLAGAEHMLEEGAGDYETRSN